MIAAAFVLAMVEPTLVQVCRGSGAYIAPDRILTAHHVVAAPDCILPYGKVVLADPENDVAVIETEKRSTAWLPVACKPAREALTASHTGSAASMRWVRGNEFEGRVSPGNSGSPIVNAKGEVFAVVSRGPGWSLDSHFQRRVWGGMLKRTELCRRSK